MFGLMTVVVVSNGDGWVDDGSSSEWLKWLG